MAGKSLLIFTLVLLSFAGSGFGQSTFEKRFIMPNSLVSTCITNANDGGYILGCGSARKNDFNFSDAPMIIKVSSKGELEWMRYLPLGKGLVESIWNDHGNGYMIVSYLMQETAEDPSLSLTKINSNGDVSSTCTVVNMFSVAAKPIFLPNGGYIIKGESGLIFIDTSGSIKSFFEINSRSGRHALLFDILSLKSSIICALLVDSDGVSTGEVLKMSLKGEILWERQLEKDMNIRSILGTPDNGFIICGGLDRSINTRDMFVERFDSSGTILWGKAIDAFASEQAVSMVEGSNGDYVILGNDNKNLIIATVSPEGSVKMVKRFSVDNIQFIPLSIIKSNEGKGFVISGDVLESDSIIYSALLMSLDSNLENCNAMDIVYQTHTLGTISDSSFFFIDSTTIVSNRIIGDDKKTFTCSEESFCDLGVTASFVKNDPFTFPNPAAPNQSISINDQHLKTDIPYIAIISDVMGKEVYKEILTFSGNKPPTLVGSSNYPSGVYFLDITSEQDPIPHRFKFIKE